MENRHFDPTAPPAHLSPEAQAWWVRITEAYDIDEAHVLPLRAALESFDRAEAARRQIDADGVAVRDRFEQIRPHPLLGVERDARMAMLRGWRQLGLDLEPPGPVGYPAGRPRSTTNGGSTR